jgi:hypothetical protein
MFIKTFLSGFSFLFVASGVSGFAPIPMTTRSSITSLAMVSQDSMKRAAASLVAAAFLMGDTMVVDPAFAMDDFASSGFGGSSSQILLAARSGGRAGGRSAGARARPAPSRTINTRVIERTTYVAPPIYSSPVYVAPLYNPLPGLGFSMGLNAINQVGNDMRDYRQETEIQSTRAQLEQSKMREAEMEARLRQLEMQQGGQNNQLSQQQIQQLMMMQQQQQQAAAAAK